MAQPPTPVQPVNTAVVGPQARVTTPWRQFFDLLTNGANTAALAITDLTGDVAATGPGSVAATLSTTGVVAGTYGNATNVGQFTVDAKGRLTSATNVAITDTGITQLTGDVTAGPGSGSQAATIPNDTVTYAKMQNVSAADRLLGRGNGGGAGDVQEIALGSGLSMSGTTLSATGSGGTVTVTGSPASGNLTQFSGATSITNGDLSGDVTTSGTLATTAKTALKTRAIGIVINEGAVPSTGFKGDAYIPYACTITGWTLTADVAGDIEFDIFLDDYPTWSGPGSGASIVAAAPPALSGVIKDQDTSLGTWTTSIPADSMLSYEVTGTPATLTRATLTLTVTV